MSFSYAAASSGSSVGTTYVGNLLVSALARTTVFKYNFIQQIIDLINSVALEEAALAAIANVERDKIQRLVATSTVTPQQLLCLNKSVSETMDSISLLNSILIQKLNAVNCQIDGSIC